MEYRFLFLDLDSWHPRAEETREHRAKHRNEQPIIERQLSPATANTKSSLGHRPMDVSLQKMHFERIAKQVNDLSCIDVAG
jgi:hypothetical protein